MAPSNTSKRAGQLHEHRAVIAHALRQHAGIRAEVEQKVRRLSDDPRRADGSPAAAPGCESPPDGGLGYSTDVVVRFAETDAQGIAHHAAFVVWPRGRSRGLAGRARRRLPGDPGAGGRGADDGGARPLPPRRLLRGQAAHLGALRRPARSPLRYEYTVERDGEPVAEVDGARDGRRGYAPADPASGRVRRGCTRVSRAESLS